jgi:hypothetical protein
VSDAGDKQGLLKESFRSLPLILNILHLNLQSATMALLYQARAAVGIDTLPSCLISSMISFMMSIWISKILAMISSSYDIIYS